MSASRGNLAANSTVPISTLTPGGYDEKGTLGRQSYSTNQMSNSASGSVGVSGSIGGALGAALATGITGAITGSGVGASGLASSSHYTSTMQAASYGTGRSGTYYQ